MPSMLQKLAIQNATMAYTVQHDVSFIVNHVIGRYALLAQVVVAQMVEKRETPPCLGPGA